MIETLNGISVSTTSNRLYFIVNTCYVYNNIYIYAIATNANKTIEHDTIVIVAREYTFE